VNIFQTKRFSTVVLGCYLKKKVPVKNLYIWLLILGLGLTSCSNTQRATPISSVLVTVEVTRIVPITTTPVPPKTATPTSTLKPIDASNTQTAEVFGTPIVANMECYLTAITQSDLNSCAASRRDEMEKQMAVLINAIKEGSYPYNSEKKLQMFLQFQSEWEDFIQRECEFRSGHTLTGDSGTLDGGSMAPMNNNECLAQKYQDRLRELQILLHSDG
jgi:uncharacterized protein YecT (DUF1311 family)